MDNTTDIICFKINLKYLTFNNYSLEQIKRLIAELQEAKYKSVLFENENNELKESLQKERSHYQTELLKIAEKIKKLKNIQGLYLKEKESSERIENQLIVKEKQANDYRGKLM